MSKQVAEDELDTMLTEWGSAARSAVGPQPMPTLAVQPRRPRRMGWQLAAGALAVALAAVTAVGLPKLVAKDHHRPAASARPSVARTATAPPGYQVVTYHGLSITVPNSWEVKLGGWCTLTTSIVQIPGGGPACGKPPYLDFTIVEFLDHLPQVISPARTTETTISGMPAIRTEGMEGERHALAYAVPALHAVVLMKLARGQTGADLAATLQVNEVDVHGCRAQVSPMPTLPIPSKATHPGLDGLLVPFSPVSVIVCRYQVGWLESGNLLTGRTMQSFVNTLNSLPPGLSRATNPNVMHCGSQDNDVIR